MYVSDGFALQRTEKYDRDYDGNNNTRSADSSNVNTKSNGNINLFNIVYITGGEQMYIRCLLFVSHPRVIQTLSAR